MSENADDWEPLFADSTPIEQDDGPVPVVKIDYAPEFERVMGYFRRVLVDGEHSARALTLSQSAQTHTRARRTHRTASSYFLLIYFSQRSSSSTPPTTRRGTSVGCV